jgi:hypothetical protein
MWTRKFPKGYAQPALPVPSSVPAVPTSPSLLREPYLWYGALRGSEGRTRRRKWSSARGHSILHVAGWTQGCSELLRLWNPKISEKTDDIIQRRWLRHYATSRNVADSIPHQIIFFSFVDSSNPSSRALGSTQPLTEMSARNHPRGKVRPLCMANNLTATCQPIVQKIVSCYYITLHPYTNNRIKVPLAPCLLLRYGHSTFRPRAVLQRLAVNVWTPMAGLKRAVSFQCKSLQRSICQDSRETCGNEMRFCFAF